VAMGDIRQDLVAQYGNHGCAALIIQFRLRSAQCLYISNQDSTESVAVGDLMCKLSGFTMRAKADRYTSFREIGFKTKRGN
jgi:hypothetical protein